MGDRVVRHLWRAAPGDVALPAGTERCARCGALRKTKIVTTSHVGIRTATFGKREVPIYSVDGRRWVWDRPPCPGAEVPNG